MWKKIFILLIIKVVKNEENLILWVVFKLVNKDVSN